MKGIIIVVLLSVIFVGCTVQVEPNYSVIGKWIYTIESEYGSNTLKLEVYSEIGATLFFQTQLGYTFDFIQLSIRKVKTNLYEMVGEYVDYIGETIKYRLLCEVLDNERLLVELQYYSASYSPYKVYLVFEKY